VDASWVQARATNFGVDFLTTEDYEPIANLLAPIQQQLAEGREHLNLQNELLASILWDDTP
jgi:hypothetical protein